MKNDHLAEINFKELLHYEYNPDAGARPYGPIPCTGFCVSCEKNGFLESGEHRLDQMSHAADTDDFEKAICKLPLGGVNFSVAFILESPGGYYDNGNAKTFQGISKQPPVNSYYWTPSQLANWPTDSSKVDPGSYGPYFAYIIATHKLRNAYFTNSIKCSLAMPDANQFIRYQVVGDPEHRDSKIRTNCHNLFLKKELMILSPKIVFYFGDKAAKMGYFSEINSLLPSTLFVKLLHPRARDSASQIISLNDESIRDALSECNET